ncbi:MAG: permease-like cell division protein FtsX, partial [Candidatus Paceibacterota bacterium]
MLWTKIKRIIKSGTISFVRNGSVSVAASLVMTVTLSVIMSLILVSALLQSTLSGIREKVDINVYFEGTAPESAILALKSDLDKQPEVASTSYTSPDQALANFKERHKDNGLLMDALSEVGTNPLEASINIRAHDPSQYQTIADFIQSKNISASDS